MQEMWAETVHSVVSHTDAWHMCEMYIKKPLYTNNIIQAYKKFCQ